MTTLLLPTSSPDEHFDGCNYAIVHIDSKELKYIDKLVSTACKNRRMYTNLVKMYFWSDVTFHDINENRLSDIKSECVFRMLDDIIVLGESSILPPGTNIRTDCDQMCIRPTKQKASSDISLMSYEHYNSIQIESASLSFEALSNLVVRRSKKF